MGDWASGWNRALSIIVLVFTERHDSSFRTKDVPIDQELSVCEYANGPRDTRSPQRAPKEKFLFGIKMLE